ncbi:hypothetical protein D3C80_1975990 [compost metagenome]
MLVDPVEQGQAALAFVGVIIQCGAQGDRAGAAKVGADIAQGDDGRHPGDADLVGSLVHLAGFVQREKAHDQDQGRQQREYAGCPIADLHIP